VFHFDTPLLRRGTARPHEPRIIEIELKVMSVHMHGLFIEGTELAFSRLDCETVRDLTRTSPKEMNMQWTTPAFTDLRFGFEITMYIATR
jgi:coenzyme PQQ precursor peptide PqqA